MKEFLKKFKILNENNHFEDCEIFLLPNRLIKIRYKVEKTITFQDFKNKVHAGEIISSPVSGITFNLRINGNENHLQKFKDYFVQEIEDLKELEDEFIKMEGGKTTSVICIEKYDEYLKNPSEIEKHKLLLAYEEVPKHLRIYLLRMEEQDLPIRKIIYGDTL